MQKLIFPLLLAGLLVVVKAASSQTAATAPAADAALAAEYTDTVNGFSLCPPTNTQRFRESGSRLLVTWNRLEEKPRAIIWSLEVLRLQRGVNNLSPEEDARGLAAELEKMDFKATEISLNTINGRPAIHLRGTGEKPGAWRRQTWIELPPRLAASQPADEAAPQPATQPASQPAKREYLVLSIYGSPLHQKEMDATVTAVLATLEFFDPAKAIQERTASLDTGTTVLAKVDEKLLRSIISPKSYYFGLEIAGKPAGCIRITETIVNSDNSRGLEVLRCGVLKTNNSLRLTRDQLFATPDQSFSHDRYQVQDVQAGKAVKSRQEVLKQEAMFINQTPGAREPYRQKKLPPELWVTKDGKRRQVYLPAAFDVVLPRLIDRSAAGAQYGFATYNPAANDFEMRLVRVVGPENATVGGKQTPAIHLKDQAALDAPITDLWVDKDGQLLRLQTPDGVVMERTTPEKAAMLYGPELNELDKMETK